jgi:hypothetical protein
MSDIGIFQQQSAWMGAQVYVTIRRMNEIEVLQVFQPRAFDMREPKFRIGTVESHARSRRSSPARPLKQGEM